MTSTPSLKVKRALDTGGSPGTGAAIARRLASKGSRSRGPDAGRAPRSDLQARRNAVHPDRPLRHISDVLGTHIAYQDMSVSDHNGVLTGSGLPPEMAAAVADADAGLARGELFAAS